jgi:RND family efflux transporter MFP subunit
MNSMHRAPALLGVMAVLAASGAVMLAGCSDSNSQPPPPEPLAVATVQPCDIRQVLEVPGEFTPYQEIDVDAKVRGYVKHLNVDIGSMVKAGDMLATLEVPELADELRRADDQVHEAEHEVSRTKALYEDRHLVYTRLAGVMQEQPQLIAQQEVDEAKAKSDSSFEAFTSSQSGLEAARSNRARLADMTQYTHITAPFAGAISARHVNTGSLVGEGSGDTPIFHLVEVDHLRLVVDVPEAAVPDVREGTLAMVNIASLPDPIQLKVSRISHELAAATRTMHIEFDYDNSQGRVTPGMYAKVHITLAQREGVLCVPTTAVRNQEVFVLTTAGRVESRKPTFGLSDGREVEIKAGLARGEWAVVGTPPDTTAGTRYIAKPLPATSAP